MIPLLLLHGWPGSVREFYDIIPLLTNPNPKSEYIFEVVAPSLPGFGWSQVHKNSSFRLILNYFNWFFNFQGASKVGFGTAQIAVVLRNLMLRLGYDNFVLHGTDWGMMIGSNMAAIFPKNILGYHSNSCSAWTPLAFITKGIRLLFPKIFLKREEQEFFRTLTEENSILLEESGYFHLHATKPDTIGAVLSHNPIGLAAYILEKFSTWTNPEFRKLKDGGLTKNYNIDTLLDNVMIYYITNSITTSQRIYAEYWHNPLSVLERVHIHCPVGCVRFKSDIMVASDVELKYKYKNIIQSTYYQAGGHIPALELPQTLYEDFIAFVKKANL